VTLLDVGQEGGTRATGNPATASFVGVQVVAQPAEVASTIRAIPESNVVMSTRLGQRGRNVTISGLLKADSFATLRAIGAEIDQKRHGRPTDPATGLLGTAELTEMNPTTLTSFDGAVLSSRAVLTNWRMTGRATKNPAGLILQRIEMTFLLLA